MMEQPRQVYDPNTPDDLCVCPGQKWGDSKNPREGLFRMGYPYLGIFAAEILDHGYKAKLVPTSVPIYKVRKKNIHPWLYRPIRKKKLKKLTIDEIIENLKKIKKKLISIHRIYGLSALHSKFGENLESIYQLPADNFRNLVAGNYASDQKFWCYNRQSSYRYQIEQQRKGKRKKRKVWKSVEVKNLGVVLEAGWSDLRETDMKCRVFAFFGCWTNVHNRIIVRKHRKWNFIGNKGFAFFTTNEGRTGAQFWAYHLITSPSRAWKKSLKYACKYCNLDLDKFNIKYRIRQAK